MQCVMLAELHIMVVDDRPDSVLFLSEFLLSRRHRVETCSTGAEALEAVIRRFGTTDAFDLMISDLVMPGMDGISLMRDLRRRKIDLPTILYSAYGALRPTLSQEAAEVHCLAILDKPLELGRIERLTADVAQRRSSSTTSGAADAGQPFFGTSRVSRPTAAAIPEEEHPAGPMTGALERHPAPLRAASAPPLPHDRPRPTPDPASTNPRPVPTPAPLTSTYNPAAFTAPPPITVSAPGSSEALVPPRVPTAPSIPRAVPEPPRGALTLPPISHKRRTSRILNDQADSLPATESTTTRLRRGIAGSQPVPPVMPPGGADQAPPSPTLSVSCAHCGTVFLVQLKRQSFSVICVACGGLLRIDPPALPPC